MRLASLSAIIISEILIIVLIRMNISSTGLSMISTLVAVVIVAFACSALLRNMKSLSLTKNYGISGSLGVIAGIVYYMWAADHVDAMVTWLKTYGFYVPLLIILICAVILYVYKGQKVEKVQNVPSQPTVSNQSSESSEV